jgi:hypothetical protein
MKFQCQLVMKTNEITQYIICITFETEMFEIETIYGKLL